MATAEDVIRIAKAEEGYSRYSDPQEGTKYGRWYAALTGSPYFGTTGVPFCAMGVSYVFAKANCKCLGLPTAGCTSGILTPARNAGKLLRPAQLKRGDVILFNWDGEGYGAAEADHVGIVLSWNSPSSIHTWEANVSGMVKECDRDIKWVVGGVRPQYAQGIFTDVDESTPHYEDIRWMKESGVSKGFGDGSYRPYDALTRGDAAAFIHRLYDLIKEG